MAFILCLLACENLLALPEQVKNVFPAWGIVAMAAYFSFYHNIMIEGRDLYVQGATGFSTIVFHYVFLLILLTNVIVSLARIITSKNVKAQLGQNYWWLYIFFFVFVASAELDHLVVMIGYSDVYSTLNLLNANHKIGFPILWGVASFILIAVGLQRKIKVLRIISMVLLLITLLKLFIVDLRDISEGGKIAAFISLGILLLIVSFMYQRLKKILLEDNKEEEKETA
jgi:hypothetical protein